MCETRWNYVYDSLTSIIRNFDEVAKILLESGELHKMGRITKEQLIDVTTFLKPFKIMTKSIEDENAFNLHIGYQKYYKLIELVEQEDSDTELVSQMKAEGRKYIYKSDLHTIKSDFKPTVYHNAAAFLHPLMKTMRKSTLQQIQETHDFIKNEMATFEENENENENDNRSTIAQHVVADDIDYEFFDDFDGNIVDELVRYKNMIFTTTDIAGFNLNEWWTRHKAIFPKLYNIFVRLHSLPSSSAAAERRFSQCGHLLTDMRSRLTPKTVKSLLICKDFHFKYNSG